MSVKDKIQNLINTANSTTGATATDLTTAIGKLIEGYGGGGGGVSLFTDIETGEWTPTSDVSSSTISFPTRNNPPAIVLLVDAMGDNNTTSNAAYAEFICDFAKLIGPIPYSSSAKVYSFVLQYYRGTSTSSITGTPTAIRNPSSSTSTSSGYYRYWAKTNGFYAYTGATSRYWKANRKYKWIALWVD